MNQIIPNLYLGAHSTSSRLRKYGIKYIINFAKKSYDGRRIHFPLHDGKNELDKMIEAMNLIEKYMIKKDGLVYVHCAAGRSRSPIIVALYLIKIRYCKNLRIALKYIRTKRKSINPNIRILDCAKQAEKQLLLNLSSPTKNGGTAE